ncbi:putative replicase/helicase/endonuclease [Rhizophagus irregularis DAOM 181602=DAOM 197198]|nr:putative replicase/helicase/endonuclease [Rhizophagus irregularis DAOM 181602=DAOM 197198]
MLITNSIYTGRPIIDETTVPSYIRTGDSYFRQKEYHINTMVQGFDEFQNRGAIHTHGIAYLSKSIPELIDSNIISKADMPNPNLKPELYELVKKHQIHTCDSCCDLNSLRYIYFRTKEEDLYVIPYHAPTLFLWNGHVNFQYVTTHQFAKYMTKYVIKSELTEYFDLFEANAYRKHTLARRFGSMELMILLLGYSICQSSIAVEFLPSIPSEVRNKSVKPPYLLQQGEQLSPYWDDAIDKYFDHPSDNIFNNLTYPLSQLYYSKKSTN